MYRRAKRERNVWMADLKEPLITYQIDFEDCDVLLDVFVTYIAF